jgi:hypothetical protein
MSPSPELRNQWLTIAEVAAAYNRSEQRVRTMCRDGTLRAFGFRIIRSGTSWWINDPNSVSRNPKVDI